MNYKKYMEHKKILFDEIYAPTAAALAEKKAFKINRIRFLGYGVLKWLFIIIISVVGSILLSAVITAIFQERSILSVITEFSEKFLKFINFSKI